MGKISTYCGSMTVEELREHVSQPNACEPCARDFSEFVEPKEDEPPTGDDWKAEGTCAGLPYDTELAGPGGVSVHFWTGDLEGAALKDALKRAEARIRGARDVVRVIHSPGKPSGFWAHENL